VSVLALVTKLEEIKLVVTWASEFAVARDTTLTVLCWARSPLALEPQSVDGEEPKPVDDLPAEVHRVIALMTEEKHDRNLPLSADKIHVRPALHPDAIGATLEHIKVDETELVVAAAGDQTGHTGATYTTNRLLRQSPCNTIILFGNRELSTRPPRVFVGTVDSPHDVAAVNLAARMAKNSETHVTLARAEQEPGEQAKEIGRRELRQLMRDAGVKNKDRIRRLVVRAGDTANIAAKMNKHDLVLIGANNQRAVRLIIELTDTPVVAVIKRAPPLRTWQRKKQSPEWNPRLSPADYVDLIQGLRRGSRLSADFLVMLGLAAAIASLGLLQDSPAVVIGSMLLAPLMTPMIATGLALAQANFKLCWNSLVSILSGFLLTLSISWIVAIVTPGEEMTSQVLSRGSPNILDLLIALFSACAAAYALARPNLVGAVAGVAIATALVPPLCSAGISIAYRQYPIAMGAGLLFVTNLVAIILGAAGTFRYLGITSSESSVLHRRWVYWTLGVLGMTVLALAYPLARSLDRTIEQGKPQPANYPLTKAVEEAVVEYIKRSPEVDLLAAGRPASMHNKADVVVVLTSPHPLSESFGAEIVEIVQREMEDEDLVVEVHCLQEAWRTSKRPQR
jgi:uncharacterized hydrophobic protein (TIGR00271 family)